MIGPMILLLKRQAFAQWFAGITLSGLFALNPVAAEAEFNWGVGAGVQYGGVIGAQGVYGLPGTKLKLAIGLAGISAGVEQYLGERFSVGYQAFGIGLTTGWGFYANYYIPHKDENRWVVGVDYISSSDSVFVTRFKSDDFLLISAGYSFK